MAYTRGMLALLFLVVIFHHNCLSEEIIHLNEGEINHAVADNDYVLLLFVEGEWKGKGKGKSGDCDTAAGAVNTISTPDVKKFMTTSDEDARHFVVSVIPSLVYFRQQRPIYYEGDLSDSAAISDWMTAVSNHLTLSITHDTFYDHTGQSLIFFYKPDCPNIAPFVEAVAHKLKDQSVTFGEVDLKVNFQLEQPLTITTCPQLLFFKNGAILRHDSNDHTIPAIVEFVKKSLAQEDTPDKEDLPDVPKSSKFDSFVHAIKFGVFVRLQELNLYVKIAIILGIVGIIALVIVVICVKSKQRKPQHFHFE